MNIVSKKVLALVFSVIVTTSVVGMEHENMIEQATEQNGSAAWYRKGSIQAAVVVTTALVAYVVAVRTGKAAVPTFAAALFTVTLAQDSAPRLDPVDQVFGQTTSDQNQESVAEGLEPINSSRDVINEVMDFIKSIKLPTWDEYKTTIENMTAEDFKQMNEDLVR
jgi:hypothetical protein